MGLSEHEQNELAKIEQALLAEHPDLGKVERSTDAHVKGVRRVRLGAGIAVLGVVGLILGAVVGNILVGVIAFCVMFAGGYVALTGVQIGALRPQRRSRPSAHRTTQ